jgi:hypothetical protein
MHVSITGTALNAYFMVNFNNVLKQGNKHIGRKCIASACGMQINGKMYSAN